MNGIGVQSIKYFFRQPLRAKDLIDVKWTLVRDPDVKNSLISREERFQCAVTGDTLYNTTVACVLRPTGDVVRDEKYLKCALSDQNKALTSMNYWILSGHSRMCGQDN